jgi:hypothetical protein
MAPLRQVIGITVARKKFADAMICASDRCSNAAPAPSCGQQIGQIRS